MTHNKQKRKIILRLFVSIGIVMSAVFATLLSISASAEDIALSDTFLQKLMVNAMRDCYSGGFISKTVNSNSFSNGDYKVSGIFSTMADIDMVSVPEGFTNSNVTGSTISCKEVFNGAAGINGLLALYKANPTLADLGFISQATTTNMNEGCVWGEYGKVESGSSTPTYYETDKICVTFEGDNGVVTTENASLSASPKPGDVILYMGSGGPCASDHFCYDIKDISHITKQPIPIDFWGGTWEDLVDSFNAELSSVIDGVGQSKGLSYAGTKTEVTNSGEGGSNTKTQVNNAASIFLGRLTNYQTGFVDDAYWNQFKFSDTDLYYLYDAYFHQYLGKGLAINYDRCYDTKEEVPTEHRHKVGEKWCEVMINPNEFPGSTKVNVVNDSRTGVDNKVTLNRIIEILDDSTINPFDDDDSYIPGTDPEIPSGSDDDGNVATPVDLCLQNAGALGWIMCPILNFVGNTVSQQYESISEQWLDIPAHTLASDSGVHTGWSQFRDIANIAFIIVILVVVLSQVTGIGLTNYSIKKMLPTIIVMAVLVNMSFIICQLAVDISNIAGNAIYNLFHEVMAKPVFAEAAVDYGFGKVFASIMSFISVTVVVTGGITIASGNIGAWLIPILLAAISAAFSIFFFFMVLAIRQAGVLILVVVSPLAIICYALPNTKSFFDRWKKLFVSLLMVYPICGALMGGSYFASGLLLSTNKGIMFCLVAMLLQVVPFFMIPSLVRGSLAVAGNIGTKVANFGRGLSKQTGGAFAKSETAKRLNASANRLGAKNAQGQRRALKGINSKLRGAPLIGGALSRIEDSRIGKAISGTYNRSVDRQSARAAVNWDKMIHEDAAAEVLSHQDYIEPGSEDYQRLVDSEQRQRISKMAKNVEEANSNISSDTTALKTAHASALSALETNQTDQNLATVEALQNMLAISDGGREALYDNLAESAVRGDTTGLELASQHLLREHTKNIKPNSRDLFSLLGDASSISHNPSALQRNSFAQYTTGEGANQKTHYNSTHYVNKGIGSYDAQSMAKMDETSLDRLIQQARSGGIADAKDRALLEEYTREAITNDNIQVQGKIANKFNDLRYALGYQKINKKDSGILPARGAMPSGFEERQSGIIVPRNGRELSNSELRNLQKEEQKRINQQ